MSNIEKTLSIIKPDAVERNLQEEIKNEFKKVGFLIWIVPIFLSKITDVESYILKI